MNLETCLEIGERVPLSDSEPVYEATCDQCGAAVEVAEEIKPGRCVAHCVHCGWAMYDGDEGQPLVWETVLDDTPREH